MIASKGRGINEEGVILKLFYFILFCSFCGIPSESKGSVPSGSIEAGGVYSTPLRKDAAEKLRPFRRDLFVNITQQFWNLPDAQNISSSIPQTVSSIGFFHRSGERLHWSGFSNLGSLIDTQLRISIGLAENFRELPDDSEIALIDHEFGNVIQGVCLPVFIIYEDREVEQLVCRVEFPLPSQAPFDACYDFVTGSYICSPLPKPELELVLYRNSPTNQRQAGSAVLLRHFFRM